MFLEIVINQLRHKWLGNLLLFITMVILVSLSVFILNTNRFSVRSMRLIMKNMGLNQIIVAKDEPFSEGYLCGDNQIPFSDKTTIELARNRDLLSKYYLSVLQKRISVKNNSLLLTGLQTIHRSDESKEKANPIKDVKLNFVRLGSEAAKVYSAFKGNKIKILGSEFTVSEIVSERGSLDDFKIFINLKDAQRLLDMPGKINLILSFECLHLGGSLESMNKYQQSILKQNFPNIKQVNIASIAEGRYHARKMTEKYLYYLLLSVAIITTSVLIITGLQEVNERRYETGVLIAHGMSYTYIIGLYLFKTLILAVLAAIIGFLIGGFFSVYLTTPFLITNTKSVSIIWSNIYFTVIFVSLISVLSELLPMIKLTKIDPCSILMEE